MLAESPDRLIQTLRRIPLFAELDNTQLAIIGRHISFCHMEKDAVVIHEGEDGNEMYILIAGEVRISQSLVMVGMGGRMEARDKVYTQLSAASFPFFGEVAVVSTQKRTATVTCTQDSEFYVLSRADLDTIASIEPRVAYCILRAVSEVLCQRLHKANSDVLKLTTALSLALR